jgi:transcriptional regulator
MLTSPLYRPSDAEIEALVRDNPFASMCSQGVGQLDATPLPLLLDRDAAGGWSLLGHFGRSNPQVGALRASPRALVVFQGPHGYISPSWLRDRTQAPTWNFAMVQFQVDVEFDASPGAAIEAVNRLAAVLEAGRPRAWSPEEVGERHARLAQGVVAFRAQVMEVAAKFKLGQNESGDVLADILQGLQDTGQSTLREAMMSAASSRTATGADFGARA